MRRPRAFTLIELLIVVAIIAILAAIALPNFREARTRAQHTRVRADMRALATALGAYAADHNDFPQAEINGTLKYLFQLTTPVSFLHSHLIADPFTPDYYVSVSQIPTLRYFGFDSEGVLNTHASTGQLFSPRASGGARARIAWYALFSHGPNGVRDNLSVGSVSGTFVKNEVVCAVDRLVHYVYDPSNGTISIGEILRSGGAPQGATAPAARFLAADR